MKIGLIGLPKSGKTSLFNLLTGATVATSSFGTARGEMHAGVARVPDARVERLTAMFKPKKTTYATFEVVDLAGIAKGEREGLEAKEFRNADALLHVVRAFPDAAGTAADPAGDIDDLETELILADLEVVVRLVERLEAQIKETRTDADVLEQAVLQKVKPRLESERPIRAMGLSDDEARALRGFTFLSQKPILHCLNLSEKEIARGTTLVEGFGLQAVAQLAGPEQAAFLADLGLTEPAIGRVLQDCYALLGLISFFTVGEDEVRAWSIPRGTRAQDAAGAIHSDIARGFIRAEVVGYDDLLAADGSMATARERGRFRLEGKDYQVQDGEICHFRFNVGK
jgi:ribosome-binding ATPase YchF (GTP1/OBG family)